METYDLIAHPAHPPVGVRKVTGRMLSYDANWCVLRWKVEGAAGVIVPAFAGATRADGLWQATCFELFVRPLTTPVSSTQSTIPAPSTTLASLTTPRQPTSPAQPTTPAHPEPVEGFAPTPAPGATVARVLRQAQDERDLCVGPGVGAGARAGERAEAGEAAYTEFNFAPSERWAAYDFGGYRTGMAERPVSRVPVITPRRGSDVLICDVAIPTSALPGLPWQYGLTAVIEEVGGVKSFWAAAHGGPQPDFHDPACLTATFAAPNAA